MNEQVKAKVEELKRLHDEEYYKKKEADLYSWGLTMKAENGKDVIMDVSDEEYEELIKLTNGVSTLGGRNSVSKFLGIFGIVILTICIVAGIALMAVKESLGIVYFSVSVVVGVVLFSIFKGLSEAIRLLQQLLDKKGIDAPAEKRTQPKPQPQQPQYQAYVQQPQPQYQVTYTTANPPFVQVPPQQYVPQPSQPGQPVQPVQFQQPPAGYQPVFRG